MVISFNVKHDKLTGQAAISNIKRDKCNTLYFPQDGVYIRNKSKKKILYSLF